MRGRLRREMLAHLRGCEKLRPLANWCCHPPRLRLQPASGGGGGGGGGASGGATVAVGGDAGAGSGGAAATLAGDDGRRVEGEGGDCEAQADAHWPRSRRRMARAPRRPAARRSRP